MPQVTQQNLGPLHLQLTITVCKADYEKKLNKRLKDYASRAQFNGFRPGHVPMNLVKNRVGNAMLAEEINEAVDTAINDYYRDEKLRPIGNPIPAAENAPKLNVHALADYEFSFEIGLYPEFEVQGLDESQVLDYPTVAVTEEEVNGQWEAVRKQNSTLVDTDDLVQDGDVLSVSLQELENSEPKTDGFSRDAVLLSLRNLSEHYQGEFLGKALGESVDIEDVSLLEDGSSLQILRRHMLSLTDDEPLPGPLRATVRGIRRPVPAEPNEAFFQRFFPAHVTDEASAREFLRGGIFLDKNRAANALLHDRIVLHLLSSNEMELPVAYMEKLVRHNDERDWTEEEMAKQLQSLAATIRWTSIKRKLGTAAQVNVTNQDLESFIWNYMKQTFGFVNQSFFDQFAQRFYDDEKFVDDAAERIYEQKVLQYAATLVGKREYESTPEEIESQREEVRRETRAIFGQDEPVEVEEESSPEVEVED